MAKWKCEICGNKFDNFHAQGFDNKIYCPLCYLKKENKELKEKYLNAVADYETTMFEKEQLNSLVNSCQEEIRQLKKQNNNFKTSLDERQEVILDYIKENQELKEKLDKYENPEDMTLMMMWCTEKVKDENQKLQTIANNCKQLKDNWDKLKEYVSAEWYCYDNDSVEFEVAKDILNKMQELENGDSNEI